MSPLPSTKPIPDGWDNHHRPVATATMTATCTIGRAGPGTYDPVTMQYGDNTSTLIYSGPCRVQQRTSAETTADVVGQQVTTRSYLVAVQYDAGQVEVDDIVTVTDSADAQLTGRRLRVTDVQYGSAQWQRDLYCEDFQG